MTDKEFFMRPVVSDLAGPIILSVSARITE